MEKREKNSRCVEILLALLALARPAAAHDFWLQPQRFHLAVGQSVPLTIEVGHGPFRSRWSGAVDRVVRFEARGAGGVVDLRRNLQPSSEKDASVTFAAPGAKMLVFESTHAISNLPFIRFNDYIKVEGLSPALDLRARTHATEAPGREIYSRRCKVLLQVGPVTAKAQPWVTAPVGLTLEIVPERNPYTLGPEEPLPVRVLYEGRPLDGALVKLTNLEFDVRPVAMHRTNAAGRTAFAVPRTGDWLINVIWTKPLKGNPDADFDTTFSSFTFGFAQAAATRGAR